MFNPQDIGVIVEHEDGQIKPVSLEMIQAGRTLAEKSGGRAVAVCPGLGRQSAASQLEPSGADEVLVLSHPALSRYTHWSWREALLGVLRVDAPGVVLMAATNHGKELMPALAAALGVGLATDCIGFDYDSGLTVRRPVYAGKAIATVRFHGNPPYLLTLRPNLFRGETPQNPAPPQVKEQVVKLPESVNRFKLKEVIKESGKLDITEARIVVSGGMGMQKPENFSLLEELAQVLGAAVGASRPVVDEKWRPYSNQVGQTGRTVSPNLYIACGISGAVQHLAGMSTSQCIVAVNKDPNAPIFEVADYGIVGDALEIIPALTSEFKKALGK